MCREYVGYSTVNVSILRENTEVFAITFFTSTSGKSPIEAFIAQQKPQDIAKVLRHIEMLEQHGPFLLPPFSKKISKNLYELRILGSNSIRLLYTFHQNHYVILHAFKKKTSQLPKKELKIALARRRSIL